MQELMQIKDEAGRGDEMAYRIRCKDIALT